MHLGKLALCVLLLLMLFVDPLLLSSKPYIGAAIFDPLLLLTLSSEPYIGAAVFDPLLLLLLSSDSESNI